MEKDPETKNEILELRYAVNEGLEYDKAKTYVDRALHPTAQAAGNGSCPVKIYKL